MTTTKRDENRIRDIGGVLRAAGINASTSKLVLLPPGALTLITDKTHALYDPRVEDQLDREMIEDIKERGVIMPLFVRKNGTTPEGVPVLQVIAGRRRQMHSLVATREMGTEDSFRVPCIMVTGDDKQMLMLALAENGHRKKESILSRAVKVQNALKYGATTEEVAKAIGAAPQTIQGLLDFLSLAPEVQTAIETGAQPVGAIAAYKDVPREEQPKVLKTLVEAGATKNHEVKAGVKNAREGRTVTTPDVKKMLSRPKVEQLAQMVVTNLQAAADPHTLEVVASTLSFILGHKDAFKKYPEVEALLSGLTIAAKHTKAA